MTILSDGEITALCQGTQPMLAPFLPASIRAHEATATKEDSENVVYFRSEAKRNVLSYGLSSYGYDCRLAPKVKIFNNLNAGIIDPKNMAEDVLVDGKIHRDTDGSEYVILPPNSYMLGHTVETFHMPRDVLAICLGKSTMARASILINVTPIEPGFIGQVVIEISSLANLPVKIYINEGIAQFLFFRGSPCKVSYDDRKGKYQHQTGITLPKA